MECLDCGKSKFTEKKEPFNVDFKGENVTVESHAFVCTNCGFRLTDVKQMNLLRKAVADKYRKDKGLLTSEEIKSYRKKLDMSQSEFAEYLKVGEASIKRWETYFVQDESQNDHIRLRCDKDYSELASLLMQGPDIYTGNKKYDLDIMQTIILMLIPVFKSPLFINKALFYIDFLHYKKYMVGVTGSAYCSLDHGPCPDKFRTIFNIMIENELITKDRRNDIMAIDSPDLGTLDDTHKEVLEQIIQIGKEKGEKYLRELSHQEKAYKDNYPYYWQQISYKYAKNLKITKYLK